MRTPDTVLPSPAPAAEIPSVDNQTPYPTQYIQMLDVLDQVFHVVILKQTYDLRQITENGEPALNQEQAPLCLEDQYYDRPDNSSLIQESDLAPFKPRCDILFSHATAYAPEGKSLTSWPIRVQLGEWQKMLTVTGPRYLERSFTGSWILSKPEPCTQVAIRYEHAWGGTCRFPVTAISDDAAEQHWAYPENTIGCGYAPKDWLKLSRVADIDAPQLEIFKQPFTERDASQQNYPVVGLGAINRWWSPRLQYAGTYDAQWKNTRWPLLPEDFEFDYWNCAPEDQQIAYPQGGEAIHLQGLLADQELNCKLPKKPVTLLLHLKAGVPLFKPMTIDTVLFNMESMQLSLVYRAVVAAEADVAAIDVGQWDIQAAREHNQRLQAQRANS